MKPIFLCLCRYNKVFITPTTAENVQVPCDWENPTFSGKSGKPPINQSPKMKKTTAIKWMGKQGKKTKAE